MEGSAGPPAELLPALICKTFPAYKVEEIMAMDDIGPLMRIANLWGWHESLQACKRSKWKEGDAAVRELLQYDFEIQKKIEDAQKGGK